MEMLNIETGRLLLRGIQPGDEGDVFEICSDEQGCLDDGGFHAYREINGEFLALFVAFTQQRRYAVVLKAENKLIGLINLMDADRAVATYELGFNFNPRYRRKGYAYEALSALVGRWFSDCGVEMFIAKHFSFNSASRKLIEKLGFSHEGTEHKALYHAVLGPCDLECWYLDKKDRQRKYYEAYDERYKTAHKLGLQWSGSQHTEIISDVLSRCGLPKAAKLLELGCGEGSDAAHLLERGFDLLATDISPTAVEYCRSKYPAYKDSFAVLDFVDGRLEEKYYFIYAVAVIHMLVEDSHRDAFYRFIRKHLSPGGLALICTMGDGKTEYKSDTATAFELQERFCGEQKVMVAGTSCRMVSRETLTGEIRRNGLAIVEMGQTSRMPDFNDMTYAVIK